jgi:hypothetical protein
LYNVPSLLKKSLSISKYLYPFKRVSTPIRRNFFTQDDGNFTADLQNFSLMSLDESIGKIEVNPKEEAIHLCQTILQCPKTTQMQCYAKGIFHLVLI